MARANTLTARQLSSRGGGPRGTRAAATVERILDGALELLNREGGAAVTTNHIAAHLGMSPGNLYYHFRHREEIVRAIFPRIEAEGLAATALPAGTHLTAHEFGERHLRGLHTLWQFRFFFRDLNQLLARDAALAASFRDYERRLHAQYRAIFAVLIAQGSMRPPDPPEDLDRLVAASILVWTSWIPHLTALRSRPGIRRGDVVEGALHSFLVVAPLLEAAFAAETRAVIEGHRRAPMRARG
jgi:AcrR family transcriptional regulator